ncbi:flippase-like domain-containing protein (plasmid) [Halobacterium sp. NMX12-1]|uniref:Flippase-like domain-containing protein n=1 Tax=Halobacterium sp. NMX12-1 TaxID=3166650 RepID=A0AAU8C8C4_9EURY
MSARRRIVVRFAVAAVVVAALVFGVGWERVLRDVRTADPVVFAFVPVSVFAALLAGAEGVRLALGVPARGGRARVVRRAFFGAAVVRTFLPAGNVGGSGFVVYAVSRHEEITASEAFAAVTSWEFVVMLVAAVVCVLGLAGLPATGRRPFTALEVVAALVVVLAVAAAAVAVLGRSRDRVARGVGGLLAYTHPILVRVVPRYSRPVDADAVRRALDTFYASVRDLASDRHRFALLVCTALTVRLCWILALYASLLAVGVVVSPAAVAVAVVVSGFARIVPLPASVGPVDAALGALLVALTPHLVGELASALVLNRAGTLLVQVLVGGSALWTLDVTPGDIPTEA